MDIQDKLEKLFSKYTPITSKKNEAIIAGNNPTGVFYLSQGYIRQSSVSPSGAETLLNLYKPGTFFPMTWAIADIPNSDFFETLTPIKAWRAPKHAVVDFLRQEPEVLFDLTRRLLIGLDSTLDRLESFYLHEADKKTLLALVILAKRFSSNIDSNSPIIDLPIKQEALATLAGTTKETFSREMSKLKKEELISYNRGQIIIHDFAQLKKRLYT